MPSLWQRALAVAAPLALALALLPHAGHSASCETLLAIGEVKVRPAVTGAVLDVTGDWEFDNLLQVELNLELKAVAMQGDKFALYPLLGPAEGGLLSGLDETLTTGNLDDLEAVAFPEPEARVLNFKPHAMQLALPSGFDEGTVTLQMYLVRSGDLGNAFLSNPVTTALKLDNEPASGRTAATVATVAPAGRPRGQDR